MKESINMITTIKTPQGNSITIQRGGISASCTPIESGQYAFYLTHNGVTEKKFYSETNEYFFEKKIENGSYLVSFFIRDKNGNTRVEKELLLIWNGEVVQSELIAEAENYKIQFYNLESEVTFVVFNGAGSIKESKGFGLHYLLSKGFNVITCAQNNDQYQGLSFNDFKQFIEPFVVGKKVFLYGSSLGGYCALYYSGAVNGTVIAAAPKNSAHPEMIKNKMSIFKEFDFNHSDIVENLLTDMPVYIFIDPYVKSDVFFLNKFIKPAYPNCKVFEFPHAGHEVLYHINRLKKLSPLIMSIVSSEKICISDPEYRQDTDFTRYGKALDGYRTAMKYINEIKASESVHPIISKRLQWLSRKIK